MTERCAFENPEIPRTGLSAKLLESLLGMQSRMLRRIVLEGDYAAILDDLCRLAESLLTDAVATVMLFDHARDGLFVESGPSLNQLALAAINGLKAGQGSCGNTVFHNEPMYVCNTQDDARWISHRDVARQLNICSCFAFPIHDADQNCIGSFAISSFLHRTPDQFHEKLLMTCASICSVIIQRRQDDELREQMLADQARANQLNSLGVLAGGIAHDFNNLLTTIMGGVDLAVSFPESDRTVDLKLAMTAIEQARALTDQLQTLSKDTASDRQLFEAGPAISEAVEFSLHGSDIRLAVTGLPAARPYLVSGDRGQLGQLVQNLILNARQSMPDGGTIRVNCQRQTFHGEGFLPDGEYLQIEVVDTGVGISADVQERIFEPYFSTREDGHGLGLFLCYSIAQRHDGRIRVDSVPGAGTTVTVHLPLQTRPASSAPPSSPNESGAILVVDNQREIRRNLGSILSRLGYQVTEAADGEQAMARIRERQHENAPPFACAIIDDRIPGDLNTVQLNASIRSVSPQTRVALSSGYPRTPSPSSRFREALQATLAKPYSVNDVQQLLLQLAVRADGRS
ncbi:MAG: ATP-binding protein [Planctomycetaceae bacterium]|nr:ATP-binding protein [Planctomycetaceae bacterium]